MFNDVGFSAVARISDFSPPLFIFLRTRDDLQQNALHVILKTPINMVFRKGLATLRKIFRFISFTSR